jgi:hypothetical protein
MERKIEAKLCERRILCIRAGRVAHPSYRPGSIWVPHPLRSVLCFAKGGRRSKRHAYWASTPRPIFRSAWRGRPRPRSSRSERQSCSPQRKLWVNDHFCDRAREASDTKILSSPSSLNTAPISNETNQIQLHPAFPFSPPNLLRSKQGPLRPDAAGLLNSQTLFDN